MTIVIRPYLPKDRAACEHVFRSNVPRWFCDHELAEFLKFLDAGECPYFVIERAGEIVACGGYGRRPGIDVADLCWGMVARHCHGRGLGARLLRRRLQFIAADNAFRGVRLSTSQLTEGFYERFGFVTVERTKNGISPGLDKIEMRLDLESGLRKELPLNCSADLEAVR